MQWYIAENGIQKLIPEEVLIYKIQNGEIFPDTLVVNAEIKNWISLRDTEIWKTYNSSANISFASNAAPQYVPTVNDGAQQYSNNTNVPYNDSAYFQGGQSRNQQNSQYNSAYSQSVNQMGQFDYQTDFAKVNNTLIWIQAFVPLLGGLFNLGWVVVIIVNSLLCYFDCQNIEKTGRDTTSINRLSFLVPVYLYKRSELLKDGKGYFILWLVLFALGIIDTWFKSALLTLFW